MCHKFVGMKIKTFPASDKLFPARYCRVRPRMTMRQFPYMVLGSTMFWAEEPAVESLPKSVVRATFFIGTCWSARLSPTSRMIS